MESLFLPIVLFAIAGTLLGVGMLVAASIVGPRRSGRVKEMPYESGMDPIHDTRRRFDVRFHLVAIVFLLFDVELLFLYPWAVARKQEMGLDRSLAAVATGTAEQIAASVASGRLLVFCEILVFIGLLAAGLVYAWRKGVFQWR